MNSPETHLAAHEAAQQTCEQCWALFTPKRGWARFCKTKCRNDFHAKLARVEAIKARGLAMYEALRSIVAAGCHIGEAPSSTWCAHCLAAEAIKDLKAP